MKKFLLFPYPCGIIAFWYLIVVTLALPFAMIVFHTDLYGLPGIGVINAIACLIACFSSEKVEDEMVRDYRLSSIAIVAIVVLLLDILGKVFSQVTTLPFARDLNYLVSDTGFMVLFYLILFRIRLFVASRRALNEE